MPAQRLACDPCSLCLLSLVGNLVAALVAASDYDGVSTSLASKSAQQMLMSESACLVRPSTFAQLKRQPKTLVRQVCDRITVLREQVSQNTTVCNVLSGKLEM